MTKRSEIERLLRLERPVEEIAKRVGTAVTYVRQERARLGIKPPQRTPGTSPMAKYKRKMLASLTAEERSAIRYRAYREARERGLSAREADTVAGNAVLEAGRRRYRQETVP